MLSADDALSEAEFTFQSKGCIQLDSASNICI